MKTRIAALASVAVLGFGLVACADNSPSAVMERSMDDMPDNTVELICENYAAEWDSLEDELKEEFEEAGGDDWDAQEARDALEDYCDDL